jgi:RND family efflux transporter MFP subunit
MHKKTLRIFFAILLAFGVGGGFWYVSKSGEVSVFGFLRPSLANTSEIEYASFPRTVRASAAKLVPQESYDLAFSYSGIVREIPVGEGWTVYEGGVLIKQDAAEIEYELRKAEAVMNQKHLAFTKLDGGLREEDISVYEKKAQKARSDEERARLALVETLRDAYVKMDDAIRSKADLAITDGTGSNPQLSFSSSDSDLERSIETSRESLEDRLGSWKSSLDKLGSKSNMDEYTDEAKENLEKARTFLNKLALAVNEETAGEEVDADTLSDWRSALSTARTNVSASLVDVVDKKAAYDAARSSTGVADTELSAKKAGYEPEDVHIAQSGVGYAENDVNILKKRLEKSMVLAPKSGLVVQRIYPEAGEYVSAGETVISLATPEMEVEAEVEESQMRGLKEGLSVILKLDAFPGKEWKGTVRKIEEKEFLKNGSSYYRVYATVPADPAFRYGLGGDVYIQTQDQGLALAVPSEAVYDQNGKKMIRVIREDKEYEVEVETGFLSGGSLEILSGLKNGERIVVP